MEDKAIKQDEVAKKLDEAAKSLKADQCDDCKNSWLKCSCVEKSLNKRL